VAGEPTGSTIVGPGAIAGWLDRRPLWQRAGLAAPLGALAALAFAPWHVLLVLPVAFTGLALLVNGCRSWRQAGLVGWAYGSGLFLVGLHWVGHAFLVDAARFGWMMPLALASLSGGLALFPAAGTVLAQFAAPGWRRLLALAAGWGLAEWLRGHILTGFPWHNIGFAWTGSDPLLQASALFGIQGLGLLTVLFALWPALLLMPQRRDRRLGWFGLGAAALLLAGLYLFGHWRLQQAPVAADSGAPIRLVQGGIPQRDKWRPELRDANLQRYLDLSRGAAPGTLVIWPETATPFVFERDPTRRARAAAAVPPGGLLLTGTPRRRDGADGRRRYYNGLVAIDGRGKILASYDKHHLLPFGEFLPLRPLLSRLGLDKLAAGPVDFSHGAGPKLLQLPGLPPVRPLICYEILFADEVRAPARAAWLLNLTNDAWFGDGAGPRQHFAISRARAVELGVPVVRAANTGISAIIDPYGGVASRIELGAAGFADGRLPAALPPTPYARFGDLGFGAVTVLLLLLAFVPGRRDREAPGGARA